MPGRADDVQRRIDRAMNLVAEDLSVEISNLAVESGWPKRVAAELGVVNKGGYLTVAPASPAMKVEMEDLEFGTADRVPVSVVGNFFADKERAAAIRKAAAEELGRAFAPRLNRLFR